MTTITRKTRTVEYFEIEGQEYATLKEAQVYCLARGVYSFFEKGSLLRGQELDLATEHVVNNWDQLKAIVECVRVEEEPKPSKLQGEPEPKQASYTSEEAAKLMLSGRTMVCCSAGMHEGLEYRAELGILREGSAVIQEATEWARVASGRLFTVVDAPTNEAPNANLDR